MRKKIGVLLMGIGAALLIAALSLLTFNRAEDKRAGNAAKEILPSVIAAIEARQANIPGTAPRETGQEALNIPLAEIGGYGYIGYLSIPVLGLELPVMSEWDYTRLKIAPCRYFGAAKTDDLVICGHNYTRHFGTLKDLRTGDLVFFTGIDGAAIPYEVKTVEILQPTQLSEMIESGYDLTLYTCTYGGRSRVTVRCVRTSK